jgi:hypothetical protein
MSGRLQAAPVAWADVRAKASRNGRNRRRVHQMDLDRRGSLRAQVRRRSAGSVLWPDGGGTMKARALVSPVDRVLRESDTEAWARWSAGGRVPGAHPPNGSQGRGALS